MTVKTELGKVEPLDYKVLFYELWTAVQPLVDAASTLNADKDFIDSHPDRITPGKKADAYGKEFAIFRVRRRLDYEDFRKLNDLFTKLKSLKLAHNDIIDRRDYHVNK